MELKTEDYHVWYDTVTQTLTCQGALRLADLEEYTPMWQLLSDIVDQKPPRLTLDLRSLKYLNSSGFNVLSRFVLRVRQETTMQLLIRASKQISWQEKSLKNLQRVMPSLQIDLD
jgi:hypothetical protein